MPLKTAKGNMYPWVTNMHTHLEGECPHKCAYCYVSGPQHERPAKYSGDVRFNKRELNVHYGSGRIIFIEHCNDIFAEGVQDDWILQILEHCRKFQDNTFVFQTKNPGRYFDFSVDEYPKHCFFGVTIETNRIVEGLSTAPTPAERAAAMREVTGEFPQDWRYFVTAEPILKFDIDEFSEMIMKIEPDFCNIGADSKNHGLDEPTIAEIEALANLLEIDGIEIKEKHNMNRLRQRNLGR